MVAKAALTARYADAEGEDLKKQIAAIEGVGPEQIFLANGSSPILAAFGEMIAKKGNGQLVTSVATYEGVPRAAGQYGAEVIMTPLTAEFGIDLDAMAGKVSKKTTATYVCNPNNPTGNMVDPVKLKAFAIEASKTAPCFIDEAYLDLCDDYDANVMTGLVREGHNVVICRTFSKIYGMAGQRLGYGIASARTGARDGDGDAHGRRQPPRHRRCDGEPCRQGVRAHHAAEVQGGARAALQPGEGYGPSYRIRTRRRASCSSTSACRARHSPRR
jgi:histidinol-phosphate/aromatic aminotransferase/cobyric acid decarboxylase-like protein